MDTVEDVTDDAMTLLDLNDDCLMEIFKFLNLNDMFPLLGCLCKRLDEICHQTLMHIKFVSVNLEDKPLFSAKQFAMLGPNLKKLEMRASYTQSSAIVLSYLSPICSHKKLQSLSLQYINFDEDYKECVVNVAETLLFLDLSFCELTDEFLGPILEKAVNLRKLTLLGNFNLVCESLNLLNTEHIEELKVEQYPPSEDEIERFCENNPNLNIIVCEIGRVQEYMNFVL